RPRLSPGSARDRPRRASTSLELPVGPDRRRDLAHVTTQLLLRRPAPVPVAVVRAVDAKVRVEGERRRPVRAVDAVGRLTQSQLAQVAPFRVREEEEAGAEAR